MLPHSGSKCTVDPNTAMADVTVAVTDKSASPDGRSGRFGANQFRGLCIVMHVHKLRNQYPYCYNGQILRFRHEPGLRPVRASCPF